MSLESRLSEIRKLLNEFHTDRNDERVILQHLEQVSTSELNHILSEINLGVLISSIDDRTFGPKNRTALFDLLTVTRVHELTFDNHFSLIDTMQRKWVGKSHMQEYLANIVRHCQGLALTELKNKIDNNEDDQDLQKLVYHDISSEEIRTQLLTHIREQAALVTVDEVKILSDIDDTLYANLFDKRYPKGTTYPGIIQLYKELDIGAQENGRIGDTVFITARPGAVGGVVERHTKTSLFGRGIGPHTVLTGSFTALIGEGIARKKLENYVQYAELYPEYKFVFFGDSGQADALFGYEMIKYSTDAVKGVFIHDVVPAKSEADIAKRAPWIAAGVFYHNTYAGAALECFKRGLISRAGLSRVIESVKAAISENAEKAIKWDSDSQRTATLALLAADIALAEDVPLDGPSSSS